MRKQTKLVAVLSAAALLAIGASMTSMAAQGWQQEGDDWYYYDNNGDYVVNEWKKSGNNWYYLGDDGYMMKNYLLEDGDSVYYLDGNGVMVTNSWVAYTPEDDYEEDAPDHYWYYFQNNGRAVKSSDGVKKKTINGKTYGFDESGRMLFGFVTSDGDRITDEDPFEDAMYYFGDSDDGAMHQSWLHYTDGSELDGTYGWADTKDYDDLDEMWFYFNPSTGKKVGEEGKATTKTINGNKYIFDEHGVMVSEWSTEVTKTATNSKYYNDQTQGWLERTGWIWAVPSVDINSEDNANDEYRWFYAPSSGRVVTKDVKTINGKKYLFDETGIMRDGLAILDKDDYILALIDEDETEGSQLMKGDYEIDDIDGLDSGKTKEALDIEGAALYYFSGDGETEGSMKTGKNIKIELEDDEYTFGFKSNGEAYNGEEDNKIYLNGVLAKASSDYRYQAIAQVSSTVANDADDNTDTITDLTSVKNDEIGLKYDNYVVGTSGTIVKPGKYVKDADDGYYAVSEASDADVEAGGAAKGTVAYFEDDEFARDRAKSFAECGQVGTISDNDGDEEYVEPAACK